MALFRWIAQKLFGPAQRDVSQLEDSDLDLTHESVDLSGKPLKPGHRRRALRDRRLLPKRKPSGFGSRKRKKLFTKEQSDRLFAKTLRTKNRTIRDLTFDPEQLERYSLPGWESEEQLAQGLGLSVKELHHYSIHRNKDKICHYILFQVAKKKGGHRIIMAPKTRLKEIQRAILTQLLNKLPVPPHAHGFIKGRSVKSGAELHVGKKVVVRMDLRDFFPTITYPRVRGFFLALGYSYPVAASLAVICTEAVRQPVKQDDELFYVPVGERHCVQGAPTSPAICNQIARKMDNRLHGLAKKLGFSYSRYADDLTFSGDEPEKLKSLLGLARAIIEDEGFKLRKNKTRILHSGGHQHVTGVTVNKVLGLSRKARRKLRAELHQLSEADNPDPKKVAQAKGRLAYLQMLNPEQAQVLRAKFPLG